MVGGRSVLSVRCDVHHQLPVFMRLSGDAPWQHTLLPFYGVFMMLCGLASGVVGLIAILRNHERSWLVWLTILPGVFVLFFLLGEFLVPH